MRASEFIKEHGLEEAKKVINFAQGFNLEKVPCTVNKEYFSIDVCELERLVNAYDRVERLGGLKGARARLHLEYMRDLRAIEDVENCQ